MIKQTRNIYIVKMVGKQNKTSSDPTPHEGSSLQKVTKFGQPANLRLGMQKNWQQSRKLCSWSGNFETSTSSVLFSAPAPIVTFWLHLNKPTFCGNHNFVNVRRMTHFGCT